MSEDGAAPAPAILVRGLKKFYGTKAAVDGLDLEVPRGSFFGFLGPNGAGKSTTIRILTGLIPYDSGSVELLGYRLPEQDLEIKRRVGLVPDESLLFDRLTGVEFLEFVGRMYGLARPVAIDRARGLMDLFQLQADRKIIAEYSKGMRKRVAMAASLIHHPELFLMDEPFEGVDAMGARLMKDILHDQVRRGATIFLTSHVLEVVERLCDRVAIMDHGKVIALGTPRELIASVCADHLVEFPAGTPADALDLAALSAIDGVRDVHRENGSVRMQVAELHRAVPALLAELGRQRVPLTELRTHSATLEDVFVILTGRHLRDE